KNLNGVVFTHEHKDHIAGLDDVRAFNFKQQEDMEVYASERVEKALHREYHYIFAAYKYPGIPQVNVNVIDNDPFEVAGMTFIPIDVMHYKLPVKAYRIGDFTYITDAKTIAPEEKEKVKGSKVIAVNALRKEEHISHFNLEEALAFIEEMKPSRAYLTHISHLMGKHADISKELPDHVQIAYDGLNITI
ncbi:MAG: MBL fold metallo-hydrolase, partial [Bacteroidota bacterium]